MRRMALVALLIFVAVPMDGWAAPTGPMRPLPEVTRASALRMTTAQLARLLMPSRSAKQFVGHEVGELGVHGEPLGKIDFFHRPVSIDADLCRRDVTSVLFQPDGLWHPGKDSPVRLSSIAPTVQMAVAPRCRLKPGGYFGWVQPREVGELAPSALRRLLALQADARAGRPLRLKVKCSSEDDPADCAQPARVIAGLPLDRIFIFQPHSSRWDFSVMPDGPGKPYWHVTLPPEGVFDEPIALRWGRPAPF